MRKITTIIGGLALATAYVVSTADAAAASTGYEGPAWAFAKDWEPCANDESIRHQRCVWHARRHGNGAGDSFIRTSKGGVIVIRHHDATILLRPMYGGEGDQS